MFTGGSQFAFAGVIGAGGAARPRSRRRPCSGPATASTACAPGAPPGRGGHVGCSPPSSRSTSRRRWPPRSSPNAPVATIWPGWASGPPDWRSSRSGTSPRGSAPSVGDALGDPRRYGLDAAAAAAFLAPALAAAAGRPPGRGRRRPPRWWLSGWSRWCRPASRCWPPPWSPSSPGGARRTRLGGRARRLRELRVRRAGGLRGLPRAKLPLARRPAGRPRVVRVAGWSPSPCWPRCSPSRRSGPAPLWPSTPGAGGRGRRRPALAASPVRGRRRRGRGHRRGRACPDLTGRARTRGHPQTELVRPTLSSVPVGRACRTSRSTATATEPGLLRRGASVQLDRAAHRRASPPAVAGGVVTQGQPEPRGP